MSATLEQTPSSGQKTTVTSAHLVLLALVGGVGGFMSALIAARGYSNYSETLSFSWIGAVVTFAVCFGVLSWLLRCGNDRAFGGSLRSQLIEAVIASDDPFQLVSMAMIGTIFAMGYLVLPAVPRAYGGTAPVCQVLRLNPGEMAPSTVWELKDTGDEKEIVTAPVALHVTTDWGIHFVTGEGRRIGLSHVAVLSRSACSASDRERYRF